MTSPLDALGLGGGSTQSTATETNQQVGGMGVNGVQHGAIVTHGGQSTNRVDNTLKAVNTAQAATQKASQALTNAQNALAKLQANPKAKRADVTAAQNKVAQAQANYDNARSTLTALQNGLTTSATQANAGSGNVTESYTITSADTGAVQANAELAAHAIDSAAQAVTDGASNALLSNAQTSALALATATQISQQNAALASQVVQAGVDFAALAVPNSLAAQSIAEPTYQPPSFIPVPSKKATLVLGAIGIALTLWSLMRK